MSEDHTGPKVMFLDVEQFFELKLLSDVFDSFKQAFFTLPPNDVLDVVIGVMDKRLLDLMEKGDEEMVDLTRHIRSLATVCKAFNDAYQNGYVSAERLIEERKQQAQGESRQDVFGGLGDFFRAVHEERGNDVKPN